MCIMGLYSGLLFLRATFWPKSTRTYSEFISDFFKTNFSNGGFIIYKDALTELQIYLT